MSSSLEAFIDLNGEFLAGKSTSIIIDSVQNLKFLICLLNSRLISFYLCVQYHSLKMSGGYINITPEIINSLPIPPLHKMEVFDTFADYLLFLVKQENDSSHYVLKISFLQQLIDGMVYELYFPELLKKHDREIIKHLGELPEFTDRMSDEKKMDIITTVFNRLNGKDHPVRVNLFYLDSIPEIRIIEGKDADH